MALLAKRTKPNEPASPMSDEVQAWDLRSALWLFEPEAVPVLSLKKPARLLAAGCCMLGPS